MNIGVWELVLVLVVVLLLFGTGKLTRAMGDLARGLRSFKDGMKDTAASSEAEPAPPGQPQAAPKALPAPGGDAPRAAATAVGSTDQPARS